MILAALLAVLAQDGNRLTYLEESDPYYVNVKFPKLITPQWIGEEGVEEITAGEKAGVDLLGGLLDIGLGIGGRRRACGNGPGRAGPGRGDGAGR